MREVRGDFVVVIRKLFTYDTFLGLKSRIGSQTVLAYEWVRFNIKYKLDNL